MKYDLFSGKKWIVSILAAMILLGIILSSCGSDTKQDSSAIPDPSDDISSIARVDEDSKPGHADDRLIGLPEFSTLTGTHRPLVSKSIQTAALLRIMQAEMLSKQDMSGSKRTTQTRIQNSMCMYSTQTKEILTWGLCTAARNI